MHIFDLPRIERDASSIHESHNKTKTFQRLGFAVVIIASIGGLAAASAGFCGLLKVGALSNFGQINSIVMITVGGGGGISLLIIGIVGFVRTSPDKKINDATTPLVNSEQNTSSEKESSKQSRSRSQEKSKEDISEKEQLLSDSSEAAEESNSKSNVYSSEEDETQKQKDEEARKAEEEEKALEITEAQESEEARERLKPSKQV